MENNTLMENNYSLDYSALLIHFAHQCIDDNRDVLKWHLQRQGRVYKGGNFALGKTIHQIVQDWVSLESDSNITLPGPDLPGVDLKTIDLNPLSNYPSYCHIGHDIIYRPNEHCADGNAPGVFAFRPFYKSLLYSKAMLVIYLVAKNEDSVFILDALTIDKRMIQEYLHEMKTVYNYNCTGFYGSNGPNEDKPYFYVKDCGADEANTNRSPVYNPFQLSVKGMDKYLWSERYNCKFRSAISFYRKYMFVNKLNEQMGMLNYDMPNVDKNIRAGKWLGFGIPKGK